MPQLFSKSCEYALQASLYLAREKDREPILLREISNTLNIPYYVLSKVMQSLTRHEILHSNKGVNGGYSFSRDPSGITLNDIVQAVEGNGIFSGCVLGFPECSDANPCPVHSHWVRAKDTILEMLMSRKLDELSHHLDPKLDLIAQLLNRLSAPMEKPENRDHANSNR
jgi:Rrf2 family transcriptional regulator, iron-sulfur cluster assembly transcription factor